MSWLQTRRRQAQRSGSACCARRRTVAHVNVALAQPLVGHDDAVDRQRIEKLVA